MRHGVRWIFGLLLLAAVLTLSACAGAPDVPEVLDSDDLLTPGERSVLESEVRAAADAAGCAFSVVFYRSAGGSDSYLGEDYLEDYGLSDSADLVLLVVTLEDSGRDLPGDGYYYDLYLYGSASRRILQGEANAILDAGAVYGPLKSGRLAEGTGAFLELAAAEYGNGDYERSPYLRALPVAAVIALAIGGVSCMLVKRSYSVRHRPVEYPLEHFARLELTAQEDRFVGSFVTKRVISSGHGGGGGVHRGGHRGGGSRHGGGRGHAGSR